MIAEAFQKLKTNLELNDTFNVLIQQRHNAVRSVIENNMGTVNTKLIGSLQRQTRIQPKQGGNFDIDILVILGSFYNWLPSGAPGGVTPSAAMQTLHGAVNESDRYSAMGPQQDQPTVSFEYKDGTKVEFVPAYIDQIGQSANGITHSPKGRAYWIPKNGQWVLADYDHDAAHITTANDNSDGYLIPAIKMLKAVKREHFSTMDSFHLELVVAEWIPAIVAWRKKNSMAISYPALITDFFKYSKDSLAKQMQVPGSHTPHVALDTITHGAVSKKFDDIKVFCEAIEAKSDTEKMKSWRILFGEAFPTQV
ncbi:MAG: hypothetical protein WC250_00680 [Candidatus Paceibacterota bacterium]|jgi:hypothetical protein